VCLVGIFGIGGQGKTALAAHLAWALTEGGSAGQHDSDASAQRFEYVIWRSLAHAPPFTTLLQGWLAFLSDHQVTQVPDHIDEQFAMLFNYLRQQRCLLILDNVECILDDGAFRPGYEAYGQIMQQMAHRVHHSCMVCISREQPKEFSAQDMHTTAVRSLQLRGVSPEVGEQLLHMWGLSGSHEALMALIARYAGHPLALRLVATTVQAFLAGDLEAFLAGDPLIFDDLRSILDQQCATLSPLEKEVMFELATQRQPRSFQALWDSLGQSPSRSALLEALRALKRRSLLETYEDGFGVQDLVAAYITSDT
jgi:hypothetical protein